MTLQQYLVFCDLHRDAVRKKYPKKPMTEVSATLAEQWAAISAKERSTCDAATERRSYDDGVSNVMQSPHGEEKLQRIAVFLHPITHGRLENPTAAPQAER